MALVRNRAGRGRGRGGGAGRRSRGDYAGRDHVIKTDRRNMRVYLQVGENTGDGRGLTGEGTSGKEEIENESKKKKKGGKMRPVRWSRGGGGHLAVKTDVGNGGGNEIDKGARYRGRHSG